MVARLTALLGVCAVMAALTGAAGADTFSTVVPMTVAYRSDCTFTLAINGDVEADSAAVATVTVPPGPYQLSISTPLPDNMWNTAVCQQADFSFTGPGESYSADLGTSMGPYGATMSIDLAAASTYTMVDATYPNQPIVITTSATGSSSSLLPPPPTSTVPVTVSSQPDLVGSAAASLPLRGLLHAAVAANGRLTLSLDGEPVSVLRPGRYTLSVSDHFRGRLVLHRSPGTTQTLARAPLRAPRQVRLTLTVGSWSMDASPAHTVRFTVSA